ncbi:MAG: ATP-binding protein [Parvibaculaceae bacterium]|nr:ATP-binding protein [Parvibaculaceae bacterium]
MKSVRQYLVKTLSAALIACSLVTVALTYVHATHEINELYDKNMQETAVTLQDQLEALHLYNDNAHAIRIDGPSLNTEIDSEEEMLITIWDKDAHPLYTSHPAIGLPLQSQAGAFTTLYMRAPWHVYQLRSPQGIIQVAQPYSARARFIRQMSFSLLYPMLGQIPIIWLVIWFIAGKSLAPLQTISSAIQKRSADSLEPLSGENIPLEIQPMIQELNALLLRLRTSLSAQQRFTADAAHELRTPLAAVKLQLGLLSRAPDGPAREQATAKLHAGIDRATHMAHQLLTLARLEPDYATRASRAVDLSLLARTVIAEHAGLASQKHIDLGLSRCEEALLNADPDALRIMMNNLVDNALHYTPEAGRIDIAVYTGESGLVLEVKDTGMGIPKSEQDSIFERFYRVAGTGVEGTGLGLSIVKHIIEQYKGHILVESEGAGLGTSFIVHLPRQ